MDADEERDYADQDPLSDMDMEEDAEILATLLKHIPSCMSAADIEQLLQDIPVQPPVVVPARTVQEAIAAGDLPPLDVDAAHGKKLANCTNNKEVYLTVLRAHSREGHLQYLRSLEADLADAEQDKGEVAEESASTSTVDKECEAGAC